MKEAKRKSGKEAASCNLKQALLVLSSVGVASVGYVGGAQAEPQPEAIKAVPKVRVESVKEPENVIVKTPSTWQRVVIELTPEQKAQLANAGVQTDQLNITTYNIQNLGGQVLN